MNSSPPNLPGTGTPADLQPAKDYGTLGPGSDVAQTYALSTKDRPAEDRNSEAGQVRNARFLQTGAVLAGVGLAIAVSAVGGSSRVWERLSGMVSAGRGSEVSSGVVPERELEREKPQQQAEVLLERAVNRSDGATDQIARRVNGWRGRLKWDSQLGALTTAALNSNDLSVRASGIEVQLAAYGLAKDQPNAELLVQQANSSDHVRKIWALWALGLMGNRGVETERVALVLAAHLKDSDEESRRWAVEGLAMAGTTQAIAPLLNAMHNDPSPMVRERAACSLAESGMFTREQRLSAVPQLLNYSDDSSLDARTHGWAFQALGDITQQRLPNDSAAWRSWYQTSVASGQ
ncbi:MAG: HEAT repeat domain-containing protein [Candidatus Sulfotelmatobacter sp.]